MSLHRLVSMRVGVPDPEALAGFHREVGFTVHDTGEVASPDGGTQVHIEEAPFRRLLAVTLGAHHEADLTTVAERAGGLGLAVATTANGTVQVTDPASHVRFEVQVAPPLASPAPSSPARVENRPGDAPRRNLRAPGVSEVARPPRRLGHLVIGTPRPETTRAVLVDGLGFKVSDEFPGVISFLRCSTDHHNVALVHSPVPILQHYSWECDDFDHVGHTATTLLDADPSRQAWGFGRHFIGSNTYWYLRDPSGSFLELYSDMDVIDDDDAWESAGRTPVAPAHVANVWGPRIPLEFIAPSDLPQLEAAWAAAQP